MTIRQFRLSALALGTICVLHSTEDAAAQSGSRICGWKTTDKSLYEDGTKPKGFAMAFVAEIGGKKNKTECSIVTKSSKRYMEANATIKEQKTGKIIYLNWAHMRLRTCEDFAWTGGAKLDGQGIRRDICEHMPRHQGFIITKKDSKTKAVFRKIKMSTSWKDAIGDFAIDLGDEIKSAGYAAGETLKSLKGYMWKAKVGLEDVDFKSTPIKNAYNRAGITNGSKGVSSGISLSQNIRLCASLKYIPAIPSDISTFKRCGGPGKMKEDLITTVQVATIAVTSTFGHPPGKSKPSKGGYGKRSGGFVPPTAPKQEIVMVALVDIKGTVRWEKPGATWSVAGISFPAPGQLRGIGSGQWMTPAYDNSDKVAMKCLFPFKKQGGVRSETLKSGADFRVVGATQNKNDRATYEAAYKTLEMIRKQNKKSSMNEFLGLASTGQANALMKASTCYYQDPLKMQIAGKRYTALPSLNTLMKSNVRSPFEVNLISEVMGKMTSLQMKNDKVDYKIALDLGLSMEVILFNNFMNLYGKIVGGKKKFSSKKSIKTPSINISGSLTIP